MKVLFMGTPDFSVPTLESLIKYHEVVAVITQTDKPRGRGKKVTYSPVKEVAVKQGIPVLQPQKIKDTEFLEKVKSYNADIFVVIAYGKILPEELLYIPKFKSVNVHGSLLPKYRGAAPIQWAIINGEKFTGVTIMYMDKGMDTGDMILKKEMEILDSDNTETIYKKMSFVGAEALIEALQLIEQGKDKPEKQDDSQATIAPMLKKEMGLINWHKSSQEIVNLVRGLNPWPTTFTHYDDTVFKIRSVEKIHINGDEPGKIIKIGDDGIVVATKDSAVIIKELQLEGGKKLLSSEFLKGNKVEVGKVLK